MSAHIVISGGSAGGAAASDLHYIVSQTEAALTNSTTVATIIQTGVLASRPSATAVPVGTLYTATDGTRYQYRSNGTTWDTLTDTTIVKTGDTGTVTGTMIANGTIVDADINASAGIALTKLASVPLVATSNLSDLGSAATARTNLGLGTMAVENKTITTRGDLIVGGTSGALTRVGLGTSSYVLTSDGTDALWKPGIVNSVVNDFGRTVSASSAENSILAGGAAIANAYTTAAIGDMWEINFAGYWTNATGAGQTLTLKVYYGSLALLSVVTASVTSNANPHRFNGRLLVGMQTVGGGGLGVVQLNGFVAVTTATTTFFDNLQAAATTFWSGGGQYGFLNTNVANAFNVTAQMSTATAGGSIQGTWTNLRYIPKGM